MRSHVHAEAGLLSAAQCTLDGNHERAIDGALYSRSCPCAAGLASDWKHVQLQASGLRLPGNMLQSVRVLMSCPCRPRPCIGIPHSWGAGHAWQD